MYSPGILLRALLAPVCRYVAVSSSIYVVMTWSPSPIMERLALSRSSFTLLRRASTLISTPREPLLVITVTVPASPATFSIYSRVTILPSASRTELSSMVYSRTFTSRSTPSLSTHLIPLSFMALRNLGASVRSLTFIRNGWRLDLCLISSKRSFSLACWAFSSLAYMKDTATWFIWGSISCSGFCVFRPNTCLKKSWSMVPLVPMIPRVDGSVLYSSRVIILIVRLSSSGTRRFP